MITISDAQVAVTLVEKIAAFSLLISGLEYLFTPQQLADDGLIAWRTGGLRQPWFVSGPLSRVFDVVFRYPNVLGIVSLYCLFACIVLLGPPALILKPYIVLPIFFSMGALFLRSNYGFDGADQMAWIIFTSLALVSVVTTPLTETICLWFVAIQASLSYGVAGIAKATAKGWRDGSYVAEILGTRMYGLPPLAEFLRRHPTLAMWHSRLVILWECSFLLILFLPLPLAFALIVLGAIFHLLNAYAMGLNTFVWSFVATYPALLFCILMRGW